MREDNRVIQSLWVGPLTTMERLCIRSFQANGHEFHLYTYGDVGEVPSGTIIKDANEILPEVKANEFGCPAQASNLFYYALMIKNGGWFVDMDVVCLKPFDFEEEYVFYRDQGETTITWAIVKAPANSPIAHHCYDWVMEMSLDRIQSLKYQEIGPHHTQWVIPRFGLERFAPRGYVFDPVGCTHITSLVDPTVTWDLSRSYGLHLFHGAWNNGHEAFAVPGSEILQTDHQYPEGCLYEQLKRRYLR